jgi:hypothetical protein
VKKTLTILLAMLIVIFSLVGCAKCISTEISTVQVKITDEYHRTAYTTMHYSPATKTMLPQHPAVYRITVEYDGVEYDISGSDTYNKYSDKIGEYTNGTLQTKKYDDGSVRYDIIELE